MTTMTGVLHFHSETGTEGGHWAFQEDNFIRPTDDLERFPGGVEWYYAGLHVLHDGDKLEIFDNELDDELLWSGEIKLIQHKLFSEDAFGLWIHADQSGIEREAWAKWFMDRKPARITLTDKEKVE